MSLKYQLVIRIHAIRHIPLEIKRKYPNGMISVYAELNSSRSVLCPKRWGSWGASVKSDEVIWNKQEGVLQWEMHPLELNHFKTTHTKIKIMILINTDNNAPKSIGYILIDLRYEFHKLQVFKVHGLQDTQVEVESLQYLTSSPTYDLRASSASAVSILQLGPIPDNITTTSTSPQQTHLILSLTIENFRNMSNNSFLLTSMKDSQPSDTSTIYWLSWTIASHTFQSSQIPLQELLHTSAAIKDTYHIKCPIPSLLYEFQKNSALKLFLCSIGKIVAVTELLLKDFQKLPIEVSDWFPFTFPSTSDSTSNIPINNTNDVAAIKIHFSIELPDDKITTTTSNNNVNNPETLKNTLHSTLHDNSTNPNRITQKEDQQQQHQLSQETDKGKVDGDGDVEDQEYELDTFEDGAENNDNNNVDIDGDADNGRSDMNKMHNEKEQDEVSHKPTSHLRQQQQAVGVSPTPSLAPQQQQQQQQQSHHAIVQFEDSDQQHLSATSATSTTTMRDKSIGEGGGGEGGGGGGGGSQSTTPLPTDQQPDQYEDDPELDQDQDQAGNATPLEDLDQNVKHFRLSLDVHSIFSLKSAAHISLQFSYPHLGVGAHVRTHPVWVLPHASESTLDGASVVFNSFMVKHILDDTLRKHPFKVSVLTRSNLGVEGLGQTVVDLSKLAASAPVTYRCPLTGKMFKNLNDYDYHRQSFLVLRAAGRLPKHTKSVPPLQPVMIRAKDFIQSVVRMNHPTSATTTTGGVSLSLQDKKSLEVCRLKVLTVLEDLGAVRPDLKLPQRLGFQMHSNDIFNHPQDGTDVGVPVPVTDSQDQSIIRPTDPLEKPDLPPTHRVELEGLRVEWEIWRRSAEAQWRDSLREKEAQLKKRLEVEAASSLAEKADDLRRAQEEVARLEVRLRTSLEAVERQKAQLSLKDEQIASKLAQRTAELQLLQRRIREEAKAKVDTEERKVLTLQAQLGTLQESLERAEKRARDAEREYDTFRQQSRSSPENQLREETARLRALLAEQKAEVERERRLRGETELEKEHFRAQVHRLALALKREREKSAVLARQEIEQLRLEFLAREERYVLDGDREELRSIRQELASLRTAGVTPSSPPPNYSNSSSKENMNYNTNNLVHDRDTGTTRISSSIYHSRREGTDKVPLSPPPGNLGTATPTTRPTATTTMNSDIIQRLQRKRADLLATGLYDEDSSDPLLDELNRSIAAAAAASQQEHVLAL